MNQKRIIFGTAVFLSLFLVSMTNAQVSEYPQITEQTCDSCSPCAEGLECFNFPGIGSRCAEPDPCSYYQCPPNTECNILRLEMAQICPDGRNVGTVPNVKCQCVGPECTATSGDTDTVEYDLLTRTMVKVIKDEQTISRNISLWKTTDENKGILESSATSAGYHGKIVVKNSKLFMDTPAGEEPINILPEDAINKAEASEVKKVELKTESEKPVYSVKGTKQARLLFIMPVSLEIETKVSAETGKVISVNKPWWSFLAW